MMGDEWETPHELFNGLEEWWGIFNLDVCANESNKKCKNYYTKKDNGLIQPWEGVVWCNPPYSNQKPWIEKAIQTTKEDPSTHVMMLIPSKFESNYFTELILESGYVKSIFLIRGRLQYLQDGKKVGSPIFGSCLIEYGKQDHIDFYLCEKNFTGIKKVSG